jgi:hypothetical protein
MMIKAGEVVRISSTYKISQNFQLRDTIKVNNDHDPKGIYYIPNDDDLKCFESIFKILSNSRGLVFLHWLLLIKCLTLQPLASQSNTHTHISLTICYTNQGTCNALSIMLVYQLCKRASESLRILGDTCNSIMAMT